MIPATTLAPGAAIGILGGGQLGRMTALAAARLGFRCHVFAAEADSPAAQVCGAATVAEFSDRVALESFAAAVDIATFEFENIPAEAVRWVSAVRSVLPRPEILEIAQDRLREKDFLRSMRVFGYPAVLKSVRMGYDGKGQVTLTPDTKADDAWRRMGGEIGILESFVDFACEISVIVARGRNGAWATYPPVENQHASHILDTTIAPARIAPEIAMRAEVIARHIAEKLALVGVLAVDMFVTQSGDILVNEIAPRPHNSGHWTIDACITSQFEQLVRALCGLPLGSVEHHSDAVMKNLVGSDVEKWRDALNDPLAKLHVYGKTETQPGRKMGHVTRLIPHR